jgi:arabinoxylan arabinofuranohydrolase
MAYDICRIRLPRLARYAASGLSLLNPLPRVRFNRREIGLSKFRIHEKHMKTFKLSTVVGIATILAVVPNIRADYPIMSQRYLADPSSLVTKDRVYIYCSDDDESPLQGGYNIPDVVCVSSSDMKNWTDHGPVFRAETATKWAKKTWAPAAIERDGKFFLYFGNGGADIGVVVAPTPIGPFTDPLGKNLINHRTPGVQPSTNMWLFDPGVFIDDDGQAYIYFGGNDDYNVRAAKLNRDMISLDGEVIKMHAPNFFEAAWVFKRNGTYYFSYSTTPKAQMRIDYMTSDSPAGGFTYRGVVADQPPINNNNNHAAQFEFKGRWYHVYHNRIVAKEAGIPTGFRRNLALEEFSFNDDGSIKQAVFTTNGVVQLGHLNPYVRVEGETFNAQRGVETEPCSGGGMNLTDINSGDWVRIVGVDFGAQGAKKFSASVAGAGQGGNIELHLGALDGTLIGTCHVQNTGGQQTWKTATCDVSSATGVQDLYLKFTGGGGSLFNVDFWQFE